MEWRDIESAPRDGTEFLATTMVSHATGRRWRETHLIWCDDETGQIHADCEQGWEVDDYQFWHPIPPISEKVSK